ncbi:MAG: hypothetical protein WA667_00475, partial [Candidatus Nitrosopolaris sp.]
MRLSVEQRQLIKLLAILDKTCLLVISISVSPSRPYQVNLFSYIYAHHLDRWNSFSATLAVCSLCSNTTITYWVLGTSLRMAVSVR